MSDAPFWRVKSLRAMSEAEWESLCDGCGRCCLVKLEDMDDGRIFYTDVACRLLDRESCRCGDYANRKAQVPDCVKLTIDELSWLDWMPPTCAYKLIANGDELPWWHPLVSGDPNSVHDAGVSVRGRCISEADAPPTEGADADWEERIVKWPLRAPRPRRPAGAA